MLRRELGVRDLTLFCVASIVGVRWVAAAAHAGPGSILLWFLAALFLLIPLSIVITALSVRDPHAGGMYRWTRHDFGPWHGFLCFWIYWISTAIWFPGAAMFCTSAAAYALGPRYVALADNRLFLVSVSLVIIWTGLGTNIVGVRAGKWTENLGAAASWTIAIGMGGVAWYVFVRLGSATRFHWLPDLNWSSVNFLASIAYGMTGFEVAGMMAGEIREPGRTLPRAAWGASIFTVLFYAGATASLLVLLPAEKISDLNGIAEAGRVAGGVLSADWVGGTVAALVICAMAGQFGGLGSAVARMPFAAGADHLLPEAFSRLHPRWATPYLSMVIFGMVASLLLIATQAGDTARAAYETLVSLMVISGFLPYVYIFASGWKAGKRWSAISGWSVSALAIVFAAIPPEGVTRVWLFELKLLAGTAAVIGSAFAVYRRQRRYRSAEIFAASN